MEDLADCPERYQRIQEFSQAFQRVLNGIHGEDPFREGLANTPERAAKAMAYLTRGYQHKPKDIVRDAIFHSGTEETVVMKDIPVYSLCEHHLLPFFGTVQVAYIPKGGKVIGLSKIPRLVELYARRLQLQERLTKQIGQALQDVLNPRGISIVMECRHMCMEMRGVQCAGCTTLTEFKCGERVDMPAASGNVVQDPTASITCVDVAPTFSSATETPLTLSTASSKATLFRNTDKTVDAALPFDNKEPDFEDCEHLADEIEATKYRLYASCAKEEFEQMASLVVKSIKGPSLGSKEEISILDIGAGSGRLLESIASKRHIKKYVAFEENEHLYTDLVKSVAHLGLHEESVTVRNATFSIETTKEETGGSLDIVILSHCLYYTKNKTEMVKHALSFVAPGGILIVFHRWTPKGTVDQLSTDLNSSKVLHNVSVFETTLQLAHLSESGRTTVLNYCKQNGDDRSNKICTKRACLAIEPLANICAPESPLSFLRRKVNFQARRKTPTAVFVPGTVTGIMACLRAASLGVLGCCPLSVVGGGHSANCYADGAIVLDMQKWNHVIVDPSSREVRVGGGATIGSITVECEKHGLAVPLGDRPSVGMGLVLQGGLNHLMRSFGLACDNIIRVEYVAPTGERCIARSQKELFAFRGAGPNFGVVLEVTLKAHKLDVIRTQTTRYDICTIASREGHILSTYSEISKNLPESYSLDGFLYWSGHDQQAFATTTFATESTKDFSFETRLSDILPSTAYHRKTQEKWAACRPSELFDRELYMTDAFHPRQATALGKEPPAKLQSLKRCLLFPSLSEQTGATFMGVLNRAPTKWSYIHFLHGGGAVARLKTSTDSAFGCRNWVFAAVITGRYPDGDTKEEKATLDWLDWAVKVLKPYAVGVYGADLGPSDWSLARLAFGPNSLALSKMKRMRDPLNILGSSCPLLGDKSNSDYNSLAANDPCCEGKGALVIFCGKRLSGKDWLAQEVKNSLCDILNCDYPYTTEDSVTIASISDSTKRAYAAANKGMDAERLIQDRSYKELHRSRLSEFYEEQKAQNVAFDAQCYTQVIEENSSTNILLLTGMRDGLSYARRLAGRPVVLVKVEASESARFQRGFRYKKSIDESVGECIVDSKEASFWDVVYCNNGDSTSATVKEWLLNELLPAILKRCVRLIPNTPRPGIVYKDLVGGLLRQSFGLALTTHLLCNLLLQANESPGPGKIDAIVTAEATGFLFAAPVAAKLQIPLIPFRKAGKLVGDVANVSYDGSNISNLEYSSVCGNEETTSGSVLEVADGFIRAGKKFLIIDDCLASGSTATAMIRLIRQKGALVRRLVCVAELPDLKGRETLEMLGVETLSLMQFDGK